MLKIPFLSFEKRNSIIKKESLALFEQFFDSQWYVLGNFTTEFEKAYASFNKTHYAVGVSTGLDALHMSLLALGVQKGDEVILASNSYIATVLSVSYVGAVPIFVEPRKSTANINPDLIEEKITPKTKCIIPVHLYGQACEMDAIMAVAAKHDLFVVEDNAQAQGATFNGKITGSFGHINATSFYPTKNLGALGEAGAITTDDAALAEKVKVFRNYGSQKKYINEVIGYNNRIDEFEAAYLKLALGYLPSWNDERNRLSSLYDDYLSDIENIILPTVIDGATSVSHLYVIRTRSESIRDQLRSYLAENGVGTSIHYPIPPHLQKAYKHLGHQEGDFPIAEELAKTSISLPIYIGLNATQIEYISNII